MPREDSLVPLMHYDPIDLGSYNGSYINSDRDNNDYVDYVVLMIERQHSTEPAFFFFLQIMAESVATHVSSIDILAQSGGTPIDLGS